MEDITKYVNIFEKILSQYNFLLQLVNIPQWQFHVTP